jgi:Raf kinase inhibitor-like YbhB/YbcL family protein
MPKGHLWAPVPTWDAVPTSGPTCDVEMKNPLIKVLVLVVLCVGCSPAATPTPPLPPPSEGGAGGGQAAPTPPAAMATPKQIQAVPTASVASVTPATGQATGPASPTAAPASPPPAGSPALTVTSAAFTEGAGIPKQYSCDGPGQGISPPLKWTGAPAQTSSFVLIVDDPDAPSGTFTHWVAFDIPPTLTEIPEGAKNVGKAGRNSAGRNGFISPCPPSGTHRYIFTVYAVDLPSLNLNEGASRDEVTNAINGHILVEGRLMGRYSR